MPLTLNRSPGGTDEQVLCSARPDNKKNWTVSRAQRIPMELPTLLFGDSLKFWLANDRDIEKLLFVAFFFCD